MTFVLLAVARKRSAAGAADSFPDLLGRVGAVHLRNQRVGGRGESVHASRRGVLHHEPDFTAILVAVEVNLLVHVGSQVGNLVPGRAV